MSGSRDQSVLDTDRIGRLLLKLSIPAFFGMFVMTLYNVVDTIFIGQYVGSLAIAGLSIVFPMQILCMGIGQMMGIGGASLISRSIGTGDINKAEKTLGNVITGAIISSILVTVAGFINVDFWLNLLGASETIMPYAKAYFVINLAGTISPVMSMGLSTTITAQGNAKIANMGMIIGAVLNIILDAIFIISLDMGIEGAALATIISQVVSSLFFLYYYFFRDSFLKIRFRNMMLEARIMGEILAIGIASLARTFTTSLSAVVVNRLLVTYGGDLAVSSYGIVNRVMMFAIIPGIVVGQGLQPIIGFNYGARRYDRVLKGLKISILASTLISFLVFIVLELLPGPVIRIFSSDPELISMGTGFVRIIFSVVFLVCFIMLGSVFFQSIGKAKQSFITSIARSVFLVPLLYILAGPMQLDGILISFPLSDVITFALMLMLFIPQIREFRRQAALIKK